MKKVLLDNDDDDAGNYDVEDDDTRVGVGKRLSTLNPPADSRKMTKKFPTNRKLTVG